MSNLVELANELEDFPKEQLIQMSQDPNSTYPSYLVLSEIQRRTQMEKMYAAQQPKPDTTVSDELVAEFAGSPSGLGAMAQSSDIPNAFQSGEMGNMAPPSPLMTAASGGLTGYQAGGGIGAGTDSLSSTFVNPMQNQDVNNEPGVLSKAINWAKENPTDALSLAANATFFIPGVGVVLGSAVKGGIALLPKVVAAAKKVAPAIKSGVQKTYTVPNPALQGGLKVGQRKVIDPKTKTSKMIDTATGKDIPERAFSFGRTGVAALPIVGSTKLGIEALLDEEEINPITVQTQTEESQKQVLKDVNTGDANADKDKGLGQRFKDFVKSSRGADMLIGLGGAIGSARNLGELSSGISDAYFGIKSAEQASELQGLQGRLLEAQTAKYEADVANMPLDIAIKQYQSLNDLVDSGVLTPDEAKVREAALLKRIQQLQGITVAEKDKRDELLGLVQEVG
tara:strand:- start:3933 stop:5291 length:1359 start_codon:yes stop_codon:yes gene_type:complete